MVIPPVAKNKAAHIVSDKILIQITYCPTKLFAVRATLKKEIFSKTKIWVFLNLKMKFLKTMKINKIWLYN